MEFFDVDISWRGQALKYSADVFESGLVRIRGFDEDFRWKCHPRTFAAKDIIRARLVDEHDNIICDRLDQSLAQPGQKVQILVDDRWRNAGRITGVLSEARRSEELKDSH